MSDIKGKNILVTGANGFIGSHLVRELIKRGAKIYAFIRTKNDRINELSGEMVVYNIELTDCVKIKEFIGEIQPEKIYHLAAYPDMKPSFENTNRTIQVNIQGTMNLLHALADVDYDAFVHVGTYKEYGNTDDVPYKEKQRLDPTSSYAVSKAAAEMYCKVYYMIYKYPIVMLRLPTVYGPNQDTNLLIPGTILSCLQKKNIEMTKGEQKREIIYVSDVVEAIIIASLEKKSIGEVINVGSGEEYSIREIVLKIISLMKNPIEPIFGALPYRDTEIWHICGANAKAKEILKWESKVGLEEGLKRTIEWYTKDTIK